MIFHVTPIEDLQPHEDATTCACGPTVLIDHETGGNILCVHNSYDGRELLEELENPDNHPQDRYEKAHDYFLLLYSCYQRGLPKEWVSPRIRQAMESFALKVTSPTLEGDPENPSPPAGPLKVRYCPCCGRDINRYSMVEPFQLDRVTIYCLCGYEGSIDPPAKG